VSGEISEDFTYYFAHSEQVPSAVGAGVLVNPDHSVVGAGGFIVKVMHGADEDLITEIEEQIQNFEHSSYLIQKGYTPEQLLYKIFPDEEVKIHESMPIEFKCKCSKERLGVAIKGLGNEEIDSMISEEPGAEATCHFCNEVYNFNESELERLKE